MTLHKVFIFFILLQFLLGCSGNAKIASEIYNKTFSKIEEVDCPKVRFIKGIEELHKNNYKDELIYKANFHTLDWYCYINKEEKYNSYYINLNVSFNISFEKENIDDNYENFQYVVALLDAYVRVIMSNTYLFNINVGGGLFDFSKKNEENIKIKINSEKIDNLNDTIILLGFVE